MDELHKASDYADGLILNPGAWTHYAWSLRDAVEISGLPAVEVHLSDVDAREAFRHVSVLEDVRVGKVVGQGRGRLPGGAGDAQGEVVSRADRVAGRLEDVDALLVTEPANLRYVTGFTGSNGFALVGPRRAAVRDRLPLRRAGEGRGRRTSTASRGRRSCSRALKGVRRAARVRRRAPVGQGPPAARRAGGRRRARAVRGRRRGACGRSRSRARSCASAPPPRWSTRSTTGCSIFGSSGARSARSRSRWSTRCACAARRGRRSRRSSPRPSTARCRTRSRATSRSSRDTLVTIDIGAVLDGYCSDCTRTWATGRSAGRSWPRRTRSCCARR